MYKGERKSALKPIVASVASAIIAMQSATVSAASFELGGFDITFDSTFSLGAAYRVEDRDFSNLVGKSNNPELVWADYSANTPGTQIHDKLSKVWVTDGSYSTNGDMGNLNYDPGEAFSETIKGLHELTIAGDSYGAVVNFMWYKDFAVEGLGYADPVSGEAFDPCRDSEASDLVCQDVRLLDAYVYADFDFNDGNTPVSVRVGQQVLSWGESTLIPHGINVSPVDIARLKAPGADLKEAFIPVGMVWTNIGLTDSLSLEAFYQYEWQKTRLPVPGTYFSTNDFAGDGGQFNNIQLNFASNPDMGRDALMKELVELDLTDEDVATHYINYASRYAIRANELDEEASDGGQFGLKLGWFAEELNYTEFGFYYINYHSRRPVTSGVASDFGDASIMQDLATIGTAQASGSGLTVDQFNGLGAFTKGKMEYVEDIQLLGFSFNTTVGTTAISGEISHRKDEPIQIDDTELLFAAMPEQMANAELSSLATLLAGISQIGDMEIEGCDLPLGGAQPGEVASGFCLVDTTQAQMTFIQSFGPTLGLDNLAGVLEVGGIMIHDMPSEDEIRFNAPGTPRSGITPSDEHSSFIITQVQGGVDTSSQFATDSAWGYRLILAGELNNVLGMVNLKPKLSFSHDVKGITPDPLFLFHEDKKSASVSLDIEYKNALSFGMSYNTFFDGVGNVNQMADRDYVSFNVKYSL